MFHRFSIFVRTVTIGVLYNQEVRICWDRCGVARDTTFIVSSLLLQWQFIQRFTELVQKATVSISPHCLPVRIEQLGTQWMDFH